MNLPREQPSTDPEEFMGGLSQEGKRQAKELKRLFAEQGITLQEGTKVKQDTLFGLLNGMNIKTNFWQAMIAPSLLQEASGLEAEWRLDPKSKKGFYVLTRPPIPSSSSSSQ